jgi:two-component system sensor histidine kinase DesK
MKLLPPNREHGWAPYVWLAYFVFFFAHPVFDHVGWKEWVATILGTIAFLVLYFLNFWVRRPASYFVIAGLVALGLGFAHWNHGAASFFIYAACFVPFAVETERAAAAGLAMIVGTTVLAWWMLGMPVQWLITATFFSTFLGIGNIFFAQRDRAECKLRRANEEIEHLAKVAERERIARDLHDVLGHTLSLITLKSELAGKLFDRDPAQAKNEIREIENTARQALADVRQAITGYRARGIGEELRQATSALETAGVKVEVKSSLVQLPATEESVLALILREAVTNVVRHANARSCRLQLQQENGHCRLEVQDDGRGGYQLEGNGLRGMRERIEALGGRLQRDTSDGTRLIITLPVSNGGNASA